VNKENKGKGKTSDLKGEDIGKFTHKKTSNKVDLDFKPQSKNIFK